MSAGNGTKQTWVLKYSARRETMFTEWLDITPEMALEAIQGDEPVHHNREFRDFVAMRYASDMRAGRWDAIHQGFAFSSDGAILDGQHRLWAIAEAKVTVKVPCTFNMPPEYQRSIDDHAKRRVRDVAAIMMGDHRVTNLHAAIANRMRFGSMHMQTRGITRQETLSYMLAHFEAIDFAYTLGGINPIAGVTRAAVLAPVARAWYSQDRDRLVQFVKVLRTGRTEERQDYLAQQLRDYLIRALSKKTRPLDEIIYNKTEAAIVRFMKGEQSLHLYEAKSEMFPIPSDTARKPIQAASSATARRVSRAIDKTREAVQASAETN